MYVQRWSKPEKAIYEGGLSRELVFEEIVSTAASQALETQPLGTLGGKGKLRQGGNGGQVTIKTDETALIMVLASITPRISYSQQNCWSRYNPAISTRQTWSNTLHNTDGAKNTERD